MRSTTAAWNDFTTPLGNNHGPVNPAATSLRSASDRDPSMEARSKSSQSLRTSVRIVSVLAFTHSLLFLIFWLLICASAGAAGAIGNQFSAELHQSTYQPVKQRDPFFKIRSPVHEVKSLPSTVVGLQLDGILYQPTDPSAIVNGQLVTLHKIVSLNTGAEEFQVKAIEITRDHVVLEANGRRVELNLSSKNSFGSPPP